MTLEELRAALVRGDSYKALVRSADPTVYLVRLSLFLKKIKKKAKTRAQLNR